jgi:hypothetical protein
MNEVFERYLILYTEIKSGEKIIRRWRASGDARGDSSLE